MANWDIEKFTFCPHMDIVVHTHVLHDAYVGVMHNSSIYLVLSLLRVTMFDKH